MKEGKNLTLNSKKNQLKVRILEIKERIKLVTRTLRYQYKYVPYPQVTRTLRYQYKYVPYPQGHKRKQHNEDTSRGYKKEKMEFLEMKVKLSGIRNSLGKVDSSKFTSEEKISKSKDGGKKAI